MKPKTTIQNWFENQVEITIEEIENTLIKKGAEYRRNNDPFHNFNEGARIENVPREKIIHGFALKHEISIGDIRKDIEKGIFPKKETVIEKYNDRIIYLILEKLSILDKIS